MRSRKARWLVWVGGCGALGVLGWIGWIFVREELWIARLSSSDESSRAEAASALAAAGTTRAIPAILEALKSKGALSGAPTCFGSIDLGEAPPRLFEALDRLTIGRAVPVILKLLDHPDPDFRQWAARALGRLDVLTDEMFSALRKHLLGETEHEPWFAAVISLQRFGQRGAACYVEALGSMQADVDRAEWRSTLVRALTQLGPLGRTAVPTIQKELLSAPELDIHDFLAFRTLDPAAWHALAEDFVRRVKSSSPGEQDEGAERILDLLREVHQVLPLDPGTVEAPPIVEPLLRHERFEARMAAAKFMCLLNQPASGALLDVLVEILLQYDGEWEGTFAIPAIVQSFAGSREELRALCARLHEQQPERETVFLLALAQVERHRPVVLELLGEAFQSAKVGPDVPLPDAALYLALARVAPVGPELLRRAEDGLKSESPSHSGAAAYALAVHGRGGETILDALSQLFEPSVPEAWSIQGEVLEGLARNKTEPAKTLFLDLARLHAPRDAAWHELLLARGSEALPILIAAARGEVDAEIREDKEVHSSAMRALEQMPIVTADVPLLRNLLGDKDAELRAWAAYALGKLGPADAAAVEVLRGALGDTESNVRVFAAVALTHHPADARAATRVLREALVKASRELERDGQIIIHSEIETLVVESVKPSPEFWNEVKADEDVGLRTIAAAALESPPDSPPARSIPSLLEAFRRNDDAIHAAEAFTKVGASAIAPLISALEDSSVDVRAWAVWTLGQMGEPAVASVPALLRRLVDSSSIVRAAAAECLGRIGGGMGSQAELVLPALERLKADPDDSVRRLALFAARRIRLPDAPVAPARFVPNLWGEDFCGTADSKREERFHKVICTR